MIETTQTDRGTEDMRRLLCITAALCALATAGAALAENPKVSMQTNQGTITIPAGTTATNIKNLSAFMNNNEAPIIITVFCDK